MEPRGLRNCNPGNIRKSKTIYKGEIEPSTDSAFKQFKTIAYGYRAMFVLLHYYYTKLGLRTICKMIGRYAPPRENNTDAYVRTVSKMANYPADKDIDITNRDLFVGIVAAMSKVENGRNAVLSDVIDGWSLYKADR